MNYENEDMEEQLDPIAHPHYPVRPIRSARPIYTIVDAEADEGEGTLESRHEASR